MSDPERTADGRHLTIDGRKWRASDPALPEVERRRLVDALMAARRDVGTAKRLGDEEAEREARSRVQATKVALGERGPKWWEDEDARATARDEAVATLADLEASRTDHSPGRATAHASTDGASS